MLLQNGLEGGAYVAPLAGARIEISTHARDTEHRYRSLPSRERGLKCLADRSIPVSTLSLPSRERGLKYILYILYFLQACRSPRGSED